MSILEEVNKKKSALNEKFSEAQQAEIIQEYKSMFLNTIDDCINYLDNTDYKPSMSYNYSLNSMKAAMEHSNPTDLYSFVETSADIIEVYSVPFSCSAAIEDLGKSIIGLINIDNSNSEL